MTPTSQTTTPRTTTATFMPTLDPYSTDPFRAVANPHAHRLGSDRPITASETVSNPAEPGPERSDPEWADPQLRDSIRRAAAQRLALAGRLHTRHRDDRHGRPDRPGPHAVLFLFREPDPGRPDVITVASRMFLDGPDVAALPTVLTTLTDRAHDFLRVHRGPAGQGGLSPHELMTYLADGTEPWGPGSRYLGIGVSSIDTTREDIDPMPWDGLAHLVDGTRLALHATRPEIPPDIISTHTLAYGPPMFEAHTWRWATSTTPAPPGRTDIAAAHTALAALHGHLCRADPYQSWT